MFRFLKTRVKLYSKLEKTWIYPRILGLSGPVFISGPFNSNRKRNTRIVNSIAAWMKHVNSEIKPIVVHGRYDILEEDQVLIVCQMLIKGCDSVALVGPLDGSTGSQFEKCWSRTLHKQWDDFSELWQYFDESISK